MKETRCTVLLSKLIKRRLCQNPKFYADFEGNSGKGVQKIPQWKYLNFRRIIQGVIIDLMDNGGGSMDEAMKLAGMFIDSVPSPLY
jgi:carboxyl-terminal processing protease